MSVSTYSRLVLFGNVFNVLSGELMATCNCIWLVGSLVLTNLSDILTIHGGMRMLHSLGDLNVW
jgi:hypothetical protein